MSGARFPSRLRLLWAPVVLERYTAPSLCVEVETIASIAPVSLLSIYGSKVIICQEMLPTARS